MASLWKVEESTCGAGAAHAHLPLNSLRVAYPEQQQGQETYLRWGSFLLFFMIDSKTKCDTTRRFTTQVSSFSSETLQILSGVFFASWRPFRALVTKFYWFIDIFQGVAFLHKHLWKNDTFHKTVNFSILQKKIFYISIELIFQIFFVGFI